MRPPADKAEIANRLGWLTKETGDTNAARRLLRAWPGRVVAAVGHDGPDRRDGHRVAHGHPVDRGPVPVRRLPARQAGRRRGRVLAAVDRHAAARQPGTGLLRASLAHLFFNMYALYLAGPIVERWYGAARFLLFYLLCAAGGSIASFVFGGEAPSVGASGAIFGLFGLLLAANRFHRPVDRQSRMLVRSARLPDPHQHRVRLRDPEHRQRRAPRRPCDGLWIGALWPPTRVQTVALAAGSAAGSTARSIATVRLVVPDPGDRRGRAGRRARRAR